MAIFKGEQSVIDFCEDVRDNAEDMSPEHLIERLLVAVRSALGWDDPRDGLALSTEPKTETQRRQAVALIIEHSEGPLDAVVIEEIIDSVLLEKSE